MLSLFLYFSSSSSIVLSVKAEMSDIFSILKYPQKWYSGLLIAKEENKLLKQKLVRLNLLNSQLIKYEKETDYRLYIWVILEILQMYINTTKLNHNFINNI